MGPFRILSECCRPLRKADIPFRRFAKPKHPLNLKILIRILPRLANITNIVRIQLINSKNIFATCITNKGLALYYVKNFLIET